MNATDPNKKIPTKAFALPAILAVWLGVMVALGWADFTAGVTPAWLYFGGTAVCVACIVGLHFHLRRHSLIRRRKR